MAEAKTQATPTTFATYLAGIADDGRRADCEALAAIMTRATGAPPQIWSGGLVGFGQYHYRYESGREGDWPVVGFASRKSDISLYLMPGYEGGDTRALLARLGAHRTGKGCLYIKRMADVDDAVLEALVEWSVAETRRRYP